MISIGGDGLRQFVLLQMRGNVSGHHSVNKRRSIILSLVAADKNWGKLGEKINAFFFFFLFPRDFLI